MNRDFYIFQGNLSQGIIAQHFQGLERENKQAGSDYLELGLRIS